MSKGRCAMIKGTARVVGDDVNTDYIISSRRKRDAQDAASLVEFIFEDLPGGSAEDGVTSGNAGSGERASAAERSSAEPSGPAGRIKPGDIIVAGTDFGCGSAMEIACEVLKTAGVAAVVAVSFSRTFFRNAINIGLPIMEAETQGICDGDMVAILPDGDTAVVRSEPDTWQRVLTCPNRGISRNIRSYEGFARELKTAGGLLAYLRTHGSIPRGKLRG